MTRKRFKKLQMSIGYSRDEAEMLTKLVRISAKDDSKHRLVHNGREHVTCGYDYWWKYVAISDASLSGVMVNYRKSRRGWLI